MLMVRKNLGENLAGKSHFLIDPLIITVSGHGAMSFPKPRNSYDGQLPPWSNWAYPCDDAHRGENCTITGVVGLDPKHYAEIGKWR